MTGLGLRTRAWLGARIVHPIAVDRILFGFAVLVLNVSVLVALLGLVSDRDELRDRLKASDAVADCRARLTTNVTDATVDNSLATNALVVALARRTLDDPLVDELERTGTELSAARDLRVGYERDTSVPCPIP